ncbi:sideroflexin-1-3 [Drosophila eugracilis]|uniref:sideroflexin-1-3 n=1 Tax=Drosophila eugracilis TaxID=29029 RepID=UPI0007E5C48E|nr:sideroflexin-1-3 [Drosophila eugracilis]XP_017081689.1 sideroflexin-1-3 [Drosophila eugracilis]XP_017081690.1 sideroflexin-1-3 [Drosophila eugracilis]XP_017081691.1 sideroflexin-1-3 [Drosophila eugracilis]
MSPLPRVNIDEPKYDQNAYLGRVKHFFLLTNPLNVLASASKLEEARQIVLKYRAGKDVPECKTIDDVWRAKYLYDSAFHPETGEKQIVIGRMAAQMPMNTIITGGMMAFYKSTASVVFWQWFNQTFNAIVNYTNRSGTSPISQPQLITSYCLATSGALVTALSLNRAVKNMNPLLGRLVPLVAVGAANCINIPCMRMQELRNGVTLLDEGNNEMGVSKKAAVLGISAVILSRIAMAIPGMTLTPVLMNTLEKRGFLAKYPRSNAPIQTLFCGFVLIFATPLGCAFFKQRAAIKVDSLESEVRDSIKKKRPDLETVWFNKGL